MPISAYFNQILNGLAYAHAGDYLSRVQKDTALSGMPGVSHADSAVLPDAAPGENARVKLRIGLYLGAELSSELMQYVLRTCGRLQYGLTVLTMQTRKEAQALLAPYRAELAAAGIEPQLVVLATEPSRGLAQALRQRPEISFLVCNESGYLGRSLLHGGQHIMPIPVVLVSPKGIEAGRGAAGEALRKLSGAG